MTTDSSVGFASLAKGDKQLTDLYITMQTRDEFNKNYNAIVDHACQELEAEIRKLAPEAGPITQAQLAQAVLQLNSKLRRGGSLAAYEIHSSRQLHSGENIKLSDSKLWQLQLKGRETSQSSTPVSVPHVGDTVTSPHNQNTQRRTCT